MLTGIADDTRSQLRRWLTLSLLLRCPSLLTQQSRQEASSLTKEATLILRAMLVNTREAISSFERKRYEHCMHALDRLEKLGDALENIDLSTSRLLLSSLLKGRPSGNCD